MIINNCISKPLNGKNAHVKVIPKVLNIKGNKPEIQLGQIPVDKLATVNPQESPACFFMLFLSLYLI